MTIVKETNRKAPTDKFGQAGFKAERQMAFYLRRAFAESPDILIFNDLRFVRNNEVAQIDHLILHRFGLVLVESKSVTGRIEVNAQQEFVRVFSGKRSGMKSPITQVSMQKELLLSLLNDHKEQLRGKVMMGLIQAYFSDERFNLFVAVSDQGEIKRRGCDPPELVKADRVAAEIQQIYNRRAKASGFGGMMRFMVANKETTMKLQEDRLPAFTDEELGGFQEFLLARHTDANSTVAARPIAAQLVSPDSRQALTLPPSIVAPPAPPATSLAPPPIVKPPARPASRQALPPPPPSTEPSRDALAEQSCRHCSSDNIEILYGKYGYYFKCRSCDGNTSIDLKCPSCGNKVRISKSGLVFKRICSACDTEKEYFTNPTS